MNAEPSGNLVAANLSLAVVRSNRLERLVEELARRLAHPVADPLAADWIVVQSVGLRRWVAWQLAERHGICAGIDFLMPGEAARHLLEALVVGEEDGEDAVAPDRLLWRIWQALGREGLGPDGTGSEPARRFELAEEMAELFARFLLYRPDWIVEWERVRSETWQGRLWQAIRAGREGQGHFASRLARMRRWQERNGSAPDVWPRRISLFGVTSLAPALVEVFGRASSRIEMTFYVPRPTEDYWGDVRRRRRAGPVREGEETVDRLVAEWARPLRDLEEQLIELETGGDQDVYELPEGGNALGMLQRHMFRPSAAEATDGHGVERLDDGSLQVHCCHSRLREVEVLRDVLLDCFERMPDLQPHEVLVLAPDMEAYAPFVEAVFGAPERGEERIPVVLSDRKARSERPLLRAFLDVLELFESRWESERVLSLLETEAIRRRFGLAEADVDAAHDLVRKAGIRWGWDGRHRELLGFPPFEQNAWAAGRDRLLLGYAMRGETFRTFAEIAPVDDVEGATADVAAGLMEFAETLRRLNASFEKARPLVDWAAACRTVVEACFELDAESERDGRVLFEVADGLEASWREGVTEPVSREIMRRYWTAALDGRDASNRMFSGGVNFCALKPVRQAPAKVVCVLGLNQGTFPVRTLESAWDLMREPKRAGDRVPRYEDQQVFLETLLAARRVLVLSYVGHSERDESQWLPSPVITELLEHCDVIFGARERGAAEQRLVRRHGLHAFSARYFEATSQLTTFSQEAEAARDRVRKRSLGGQTARTLWARAGDPEPEERRTSLLELKGFLRNAAAAMLWKRAGVRFKRWCERLEQREPMPFDGAFEKFGVRASLLEMVREGDAPIEVQRHILQARGELPVGVLGDLEGRTMLEETRTVLKSVPMSEPAASELIEATVGGFTIEGTVDEMTAQGLVSVRMSKCQAGALLGIWVDHVCLAIRGSSRESWGAWRDAAWRFDPLDRVRAEQILADLLEARWEGLAAPIPFFPRSALAYVRKLEMGEETAQQEAWKEWRRSPWTELGEVDEEPFEAVFGSEGVKHPDFGRWARRIFEPMLHVARQVVQGDEPV